MRFGVVEGEADDVDPNGGAAAVEDLDGLLTGDGDGEAFVGAVFFGDVFAVAVLRLRIETGVAVPSSVANAPS